MAGASSDVWKIATLPLQPVPSDPRTIDCPNSGHSADPDWLSRPVDSSKTFARPDGGEVHRSTGDRNQCSRALRDRDADYTVSACAHVRRAGISRLEQRLTVMYRN